MVQKVIVEVLLNDLPAAQAMENMLVDLVKSHHKKVVDMNSVILSYEDTYIEKFEKIKNRRKDEQLIPRNV